MVIHAVQHQPQISAQQKAENRPSQAASGANFIEAVKQSLDRIIMVADNSKAFELGFKKHKLEIEKEREFRTDLEEAQEILSRIEKIMEKHHSS